MQKKHIVTAATFTLILILLYQSIKHNFYNDLSQLFIIMLGFSIGIITYYTKFIIKKQQVIFIGITVFMFVIFNILQLLIPNAIQLFPIDLIYHFMGLLILAFTFFISLFFIKQDKELDIHKILLIELLITGIIVYIISGLGIFQDIQTVQQVEDYSMIIASLIALITLINIILIAVSKEEQDTFFSSGLFVNISILLILFFNIFTFTYSDVIVYGLKLLIVLVLFRYIVLIGIKIPFINQMNELERKNQSLYDLVRIDELTNIPNRRYLFENLQNTFRFSKREKQSIVLLMIDIDDFKGYNDTFGHLIGDSILKRVANVINKECKRPLDFVGRYGGEEFLAVLPNSDFESGRVISERIIQSIRELRIEHYKDKDAFLTLSIGYVSISPKQDTTIDYPLQEADHQLYTVKATGKNSYLGKNLDIKE